MVEAANFKLHLKYRKLGPRCLGPFKVTKQVNEVAFQIEIPEGLKFHLVFHVTQLRKFLGTAPSPVEPIDSAKPGEELYEVDSFLAYYTSRGKRSHLVKWKGYPIKEASWQSAQVCQSCSEAIQEFKTLKAHQVGDDVMGINGITLAGPAQPSFAEQLFQQAPNQIPPNDSLVLIVSDPTPKRWLSLQTQNLFIFNKAHP